MTPLQTLAASIGLLDDVIGEAPFSATDLAAPTPCDEFAVGDLVSHLCDTHALLLAAAGAPTHGLPSGDAVARHTTIAATVVPAWTERGTDGIVDVGGTELPAEFAVGLHAFEAYVHAWDLAAASGRRFHPSAALTAAVERQASQIVPADDRRTTGPFADAVAVPDTASTVERLIARTGRDPFHPIPTKGTTS